MIKKIETKEKNKKGLRKNLKNHTDSEISFKSLSNSIK